jgi:hypothetical protein
MSSEAASGHMSVHFMQAAVLKVSRNLFSGWTEERCFLIFDVVFPRSGLLNGIKKLKELFSTHTDVDDFSELKFRY